MGLSLLLWRLILVQRGDVTGRMLFLRGVFLDLTEWSGFLTILGRRFFYDMMMICNFGGLKSPIMLDWCFAMGLFCNGGWAMPLKGFMSWRQP